MNNFINETLKAFSTMELLKITNITLTGITLTSLTLVMVVATKDPIIVDRSSGLSIVAQNSDSPDFEIENFLEAALSARFNTKTKASLAFLSPELEKAREIDMREFAEKNVSQHVYFKSVTKDKNLYLVDTDRVLAVGKLRSALSFPLKVYIEKTSRSETNPYGLKLIKAEKMKVVKSE